MIALQLMTKCARVLLATNCNFCIFNARTFSVSYKNPKYIQFTHNDCPDEIRVGYIDNGKVVDINQADCSLPSTMLEILRTGADKKVCELMNSDQNSVPLSLIALAPPICGVDKILCVALNYADHVKEMKMKDPPLPVIFSKFTSTIIGPNDCIKIRTNVCKKVDWEVELAVVIGKRASFVSASDAYNYVFGYTIAQDISGRDWQKDKNGGQFLLGKSQDTFCPIGPCIATTQEICDPQALGIKCSVNGVEKQNSNTCNLIHKIPNLIERVSSVMTLLPGDLILTGTPNGVGLHRNPPEFLQPGDVLRSEIQDIGCFEVRVEKY